MCRLITPRVCSILGGLRFFAIHDERAFLVLQVESLATNFRSTFLPRVNLYGKTAQHTALLRAVVLVTRLKVFLCTTNRYFSDYRFIKIELINLNTNFIYVHMSQVLVIYLNFFSFMLSQL